MTNAASTSDPSTILEVREPYPYPSHVGDPNIVSVKLSGKDTYNVWEAQILSLLKSHHMLGFINGEFPRLAWNGKGKPKDIDTWIRLDSQVKSWIIYSLFAEVLDKVYNHLTDNQKKTDFTAKDLWDELQRSYGPSALTRNPSIIVEVGKAYPYPSHVSAQSFVTVKLSGKNKYNLWETQMLCLLKSHQMYGFINGQFPRPVGNEEGKVGDMEAWTISDCLVKGWILGSLSEEAARQVVNHLTHNQKETDFTAKDLWDKLQRSYGPPVREQAEKELATRQRESVIEGKSIFKDAIPKDEPTEEKTREENLKEIWDKELNNRKLYVSVLEGKKKFVLDQLKEKHLNPWDKLTNNGNTVLHVAAVGSSTKNHKLLKTLLEMTNLEEYTLSNLVNSDGSTLLHVAAIGGNTKAVKMLVGRYPQLLLVKDKEGHLPLALSISNMHMETSECLFERMKENGYGFYFHGKIGEELVVLAISCQDFRLARQIIFDYPHAIHSDSDVLTGLAQNFPRELDFWEKSYFHELWMILHPCWIPLCTRVDRSRCLQLLNKTFFVIITGLYALAMLFYQFHKVLVRLFLKDTSQIFNEAKNLLTNICREILIKDSSTHHRYYNNSIFEATRKNASTFIRIIMWQFPDAIWSTNDDGHNFIQYSVINRSEKIYNLLYEMSEHKNNIYKTIQDSSGNNLLHLAARLAPINKLNQISGAALQMQRELQWFKEVRRFVCPLNRIQKNFDDETPQMVFTREHKDLVIEGES